MLDLPLGVAANVSLRPFNTFQFDYRAEYLVVVESCEQLTDVMAWAKQQALAVTCLGGGSNLLLQGDVSGLVIVNRISGCSVTTMDDDRVLVQFGGGMPWHDCVRWAVEQQFWGIENLALIPGTAGAAPVQNIGAYGVELKDVLHQVHVFDRVTGQFDCLAVRECGFGYRESRFKHEWKERYIIVAIDVQLLRHGAPQLEYGGLSRSLPDQPTLEQIFTTVCQVRQAKLPDPKELANAGSFFKNPIVDQGAYERLKQRYPDLVGFAYGSDWKLAAGWLNDKAGWKGYRQGNVGVYDKQALVLVNYADDKAVGLQQLEADIKQSVYDKFGVTLEREPVLLGVKSCQ